MNTTTIKGLSRVAITLSSQMTLAQLFVLLRYAVLSTVLLLFDSTSVFAAGYRLIEKENLKVHVWYPTDANEQPVKYGPFDANFAVDAKPVKGKYQPVLMSHGNSGRARNHYLSATMLADAGFIAIAPLHTPDHLIGTESTAKALNWRAKELQVALELVMRDDELSEILDISLIHGLGFSLGGLTIMQAAGATIDLTAVEEHCAQDTDLSFCAIPSWFLRTKLRRLRGVTVHSAMRETPNVFNTLPYINGNIAVVAPVGQGAVINSNYFIANKVYVVGFSNDTVVVPEFHAQYLESIVPPERLYKSVLLPAHHEAFIAPFSERVTKKESIPAAIDPPGFNRSQFLADLNRRLRTFYQCCR